jgi:hypothetical protein
MPERDVTQTLATYINADGATSYALQGETVTVHHDNIKAFDAANGTAPAAKRRPPKKPKGG